MNDDKIIITPDQAIDALLDGETVHNFIQSGPMMLGCDYSREHAIKAIRNADSIEIGGDACKGMKHPLVVWKDDKYSFFEADMDAIEKLEQC